jgi:hypothetical protein
MGLGQSGAVRYVNPAVSTAYQLIQDAIDDASQGDTILIAPKEAEASTGDTDPDSYTENLTLGAGKDGVSLVGIGRGIAQGGQPQIKVGTTTTSPILTVNAFGCAVIGLTFNGAGATGGGIKLNSNGSTQDAGGFVAKGCHFKNMAGSGAAATGGAIYWSSDGGAWYVAIDGNEFFDCRAGVVLIGTSQSRPKGIKIRGNYFWSSANTTVDCDVYLAGGSGVNGLVVEGNVFGTVDVPAYASSPTAARYLDLTGCTNGILANNAFACLVGPTSQTEVTFGASGTAAKIPTTVRMANNYGEAAAATSTEQHAGST